MLKVRSQNADAHILLEDGKPHLLHETAKIDRGQTKKSVTPNSVFQGLNQHEFFFYIEDEDLFLVVIIFKAYIYINLTLQVLPCLLYNPQILTLRVVACTLASYIIVNNNSMSHKDHT